MSFKKLVSYLVTLALLLVPVAALSKRQAIYDWWVLKDYTPPTLIEKLATETTMTEKGKKIFYVAKPELKAKEEFRGSCESAEKTIVLGCYKTGSGIYVYDVTDERLAGIQQVTAAHEMLHAAYERLGRSEKQRIDDLTSQEYTKLTDARIRKNVEAYRTRDESVVPNELHSIIATEVKAISSELESYYRQYFSDRSKIVAYSVQYESEFSKRTDAVEAYDVQLAKLKGDIDTYNASLKTKGDAIDAESNRLDTLLAANRVSEYNAGIPNYKRLVSSYNNDVSKLKSTIASYNKIVQERNLVVEDEQELFNAIDTRVPDAK